MCGFLAEFCFKNGKITGFNDFKSLLAFSKNRGPDSTEIIRLSNAQLGFNRLAILDLSSAASQPKQSPSGRYHVVFNGEIYNYKDLALDYNLRNLSSTSDTEVLVHLIDLLGLEQTISKLNGMFAIAVLDIECHTLYLTRDFAGIKPLFYGVSKKGIVSASQFDQIFKHPWFRENLKLRPQAVKEYFGFGYMQAPNTIYENINQVNPGELLIINSKGSIVSKRIRKFNKIFKSSIKLDLERVLKEAVARQLVSDVPLATFLSGGIDSPLVSIYAKKAKPDIQAFTLKVDDAKLNESEIATSYAKHLDFDHKILAVGETSLLRSVDNHFKAYSEPFGDYSSIPTYVITREAKKNHTVMLSGDGGDELFFGYPRMLDILNKKKWFYLPFTLRKILCKITNTLGLTNTYAPYLKTYRDFVINKHLKLPKGVLDKSLFEATFTKEMLKLNSLKPKFRKSSLNDLRWNEFYTHLQRVLIKVDRASMHNSVEVRVPFLDLEVIKVAWSLTSNLKSKDDLKINLKKLLKNELPEALINKEKMGFTVPLLQWFHGALKEDLVKFVFEIPFYGEGDVINADILRRYVKDFLDKKHQNVWGVWHIYAWQKWAYYSFN